MLKRIGLWLSIAIGLGSCSIDEIVPERFYPRNDHEAYLHALKQAGLDATALGKEWVAASKRPFEEEINVKIPYQEAFIVSDLEPDAHGYRFEAKKGQKILVDISMITVDTTRLFVDLFRVESDSLSVYKHVASADSTLKLGFEPRKHADYILRLQPELLRGGQFTITIETIPTLDFPVIGKDENAIQSIFGDPRDGGKREHHGVDIFAKRHTPVIAPVDGSVRFVGTRGIGGEVVWLRDTKRGNSLYFAHLEEFRVKKYDKVKVGDTLGTVGNSGNARTTAPHLHFGIYKNGPIDPYPYIVAEHERVEVFEPDTALLGKKLRFTNRMVIYQEMDIKTLAVDTLQNNQEVEIVAVNHNYVRVEKPRNGSGFLTKSQVVEK